MFVGEFSVSFVGPDVVGYCEEHADHYAEEGETAYAWGPTALLLVDYWEGGCESR